GGGRRLQVLVLGARSSQKHTVPYEERGCEAMNAIFKTQLPRRTFLRGVGSVLALPMLDAMAPALVRAAATPSPTRLAILYFPNGVQIEAWNMTSPTSVAPLPETLPRTLAPLTNYRNDIT